MMDILRLGDREVHVAVHQHDFRTYTAHHHGIRCGAADEAGSDDSDFHGVILIACSRLTDRAPVHPSELAPTSPVRGASHLPIPRTGRLRNAMPHDMSARTAVMHFPMG